MISRNPTTLFAATIAIFLSLSGCGGSGSSPDTAQANSNNGDTSAIAGFWDFSDDSGTGVIDEQYVHLTDDGKWFVYARFASESNAELNCYEKQEVSITYIAGKTYEVVSTTGYRHEIDLAIINGELEYTYAALGNAANLQTEYFPEVENFTAQDLPVCDA